MRKLIYILPYVILIFFSIKTTSQQINWNQIDSRNIMDVIANQNPDIGTYSATIQIGNLNEAQLLLNDKTSISLQQIGDYNRLYFNNSFTETEVKTTITTQGYNNIIDITGSNSISDNMRLNVKGDNMIIFVRNY